MGSVVNSVWPTADGVPPVDDAQRAAVAQPSLSAGAAWLLRMLRDGAPRTRSEIADATGLARSTVAQRVDTLLSSRLVGPAGEARSTGGRPPAQFAFNPSARIVLAADIGATHARIAVTDLGATVLTDHRADLGVDRGPQDVLAWVVEHGQRLIREVGRDISEVAGIGVGLPGPVEYATGRPISPPIMPGWDGFDVRSYLKSELGLTTVVVDNDVNIMAVGEHFSNYPDIDNLVFVKVATGIGSGIIIDGALRRGAQGAAGDLGHLNVPHGEEAVCHCGNTGCLEAVASGDAIASKLRARGVEAETSNDVVRLARSGSVETLTLVRDAGRTLGEVLASVVSLLNPSVIVIGGPIAEAGEGLLAGVREVVYGRSLPLATQHLRIVRSHTGERGSVIGAAVEVVEHVLAPEHIDSLLHTT
ncbi:ROK family transcriptional regulator [Phytoactinopolyspora limicola]|uniref:ROK family transcriptional regulator n=1 Tax=Phytoactinopolyspora limicola TaxID=2715536 RepID=UPI00140E6863|nr:ROK family transcriptional regulator [Phytoactinopolyspora limicola]